MTTLCARFGRTLVLAVAVFAICGPTLGADQKFKYEGMWEGTLSDASVPKGDKDLTWEKSNQVRLTFSKGKVSVYHGKNGQWRESKPGEYQLKILDTNAVIFSISSGRDADGTWVETRSFQVSVIDATHLFVTWQRQVKNKNMESTNPNAVWGLIGYGELARVIASGA